MAFYDILMLVVIIGAIWFGYWKGLAWQVASVAAIIVSYIVAIKFREPVAQFITAEEPWNRIAAMLILFLGTSLFIWSIYGAVSRKLTKMELKGFDRQSGALLGAFKGAILCMVITMFSVSLLGDKAHDAIHASRSGRYVVAGITKLSAIVPPEIAKYTDPHVENFHNAIGHDGSLAFDQYPEHPPLFHQQGAESGTVQNANTVPTYQGQWQWQSSNSQAPANQTNWSFGGGSSQGNNGSVIGSNAGWPDVQNKARELYDSATDAASNAALEAARRAANDAARRVFEQGGEQR